MYKIQRPNEKKKFYKNCPDKSAFPSWSLVADFEGHVYLLTNLFCLISLYIFVSLHRMKLIKHIPERTLSNGLASGVAFVLVGIFLL